MNRRGAVAAAVLVAWAAGLGVLVRQEYFRPHIERLAEAALRVSPAAIFYAVMQGERQVGFASSTIDTTTSTIEQRDYLVAEVPDGARTRRAEMRTTVILSRTLRLRSFETSVEMGAAPRRVSGTVDGDSVLVVATDEGGAPPDTVRVALAGGVLLPTLVPLAVALDERPSIGKSYLLPVFDPGTRAYQDLRVDVRAESLFVVNDSSVFDSTTGRWQGVLPDTIRAWEITGGDSGGAVGGWVDERGRLVATSHLGLALQRRPYEVAFENWRRQGDTLRVRRPVPAPLPTSADRDLVASTALAAGRRPVGNPARLKVLLRGRIAREFSVFSGRQRLRLDTLVVDRASDDMMTARYNRVTGAERATTPHLAAEQFLEVDHPEIQALAERLAARAREPEVVAERILRWVHDSVAKSPQDGIPSALHVLHTRRGDANEHTQLFVALARAAGIPTRVVTGLLHVDGRLYYHAWPEVMLRGWVAVDPTFGQFPADASHIRLRYGGLGQAELFRLIGTLQFEALTAR